MCFSRSRSQAIITICRFKSRFLCACKSVLQPDGNLPICTDKEAAHDPPWSADADDRGLRSMLRDLKSAVEMRMA